MIFLKAADGFLKELVSNLFLSIGIWLIQLQRPWSLNAQFTFGVSTLETAHSTIFPLYSLIDKPRWVFKTHI